ncbi:MAG: hypothetical protein HC927_05160 [Deltaproteobacteria bacterium]|nr:hypothetical protein [Deltaproteobacteria bacterium]
MLDLRRVQFYAIASLTCLTLACSDSKDPTTSADEVGDGDGDGDPTGDGDSNETGTGSETTGDGDEEGPTTDEGDTSNPTTDDDADSDDTNDDADDDAGPKFDLGMIGDQGEGGGVPLKGSCRESEIYGASGGFPKFEDPAYAAFLDKKVAIVTHNNWDGPPIDYSLTIIDIDGPPPPPNMNYLAPLYHRSTWTKTNLGRIFGLTLDSDGNIYVAATTVYGSNPTPAVIKRIDSVTGEISVFATLPNNGPAFGNINYDCVSETIYAANHEDGRIYQLDMNGDVVSTYHHATGNVTMGPANDPGEPNGQFAPLGERIWAVQSHAGRLYYSVWWEHSQASNPNHNNEIWSVAYVDEDGVPDPATAKKEFDVPPVNNTSQPVSDLSFAHDGWMLISQRTMNGDMQTGAHQSTTFDYDYQNGVWVWQGTNYVVGELLPYSAAGGVDHDFDPEGYVWMTGDALDFYTPQVVYGLQGTPYGGGGIENSTLIDLDHEVTQQDKTVYGDVELPIPGDVAPVPPPA